MTQLNEPYVEDIEEAVRPHGPYRVQIGDADLNFRPAVLDDPVPTGLQILDLAEQASADIHYLRTLRGRPPVDRPCGLP